MLRRINVACIALLALPLLLTGCQPESPAPEPALEPAPTPAPAPLAPFLSKVYKNGLLSQEYTYEGKRPVQVTDYNDKGQVFKTATNTYDAAGRITRISVRSANFPSQEEDRTFTYNAEGLVAKIELTAVNNVRRRASGDTTLAAGEMFAYTAYEYNAGKALVKSSNFAKYNTNEDWPEVTNFASPVYYMTYAYDAAGNTIKKTAHSMMPPWLEAPDMVDEHVFTYDTQKNPHFYSFLLDEDIPNPRMARHNILTRRSTSNYSFWEGQYQDYTTEYNADGFPTKRTLVEGGGYLSRSGERTIVYTYEYGMR